MSVLRLKEVLKEKGFTSKDLSEKVGISKTSISQIITENQQPRFELLLQIAKVLNVDVRELFNPTKEEEAVTQLYLKNETGEFVKFGKLKLDK